MLGTISAGFKKLACAIGLDADYEHAPVGLKWRSNTFFICFTVGVGMSVDVFLYTLIVPVIPFILKERLRASPDQIQSLTSALLTAFAGASCLFSPVAGFIADRTSTRQAPFLVGLIFLLLATVLLYVGQSLPVLILARIMQGTSGSVVWTVGMAMCIDTVGPDALGTVIGTVFSFVSLASLMGPVVGGALYRSFGYEGVFAVGAAVLVVDFLMRLLVIEKKVAARYKQYEPVVQDENNAESENGTAQDANGGHEQRNRSSEEGEDEETPLLPTESKKYHIEPSDSAIFRTLPILHCFRNTSLVTSFLVAFVQSTLFGFLDSTVPLEANDLFGFDSLQAGLLFLPIGATDLVMGPLAGWAVDRYGTKPGGVLGFAYLAPVLVSLRAVHPGGRDQIVLYAVLLALNGLGLSAISAPSLVESGVVVDRFYKANRTLFGENGPYAQLYGISSMLFSAGLAVGPVLAGYLRESIGYGNMNLVAGVICAVTSLVCLFFLGEPIKFNRRKQSETPTS